MAAKKRSSKKVAAAKSAPAKKVKAEEEDGPGGLPIRRETYQATKSATGKRSYNCGDEIAEILDGKDLEESFQILDQVIEKAGSDVDTGELRKRWAHLNVGMQRMQIGHKIRKIMKDGNLELNARGQFVRAKKAA